MSLPAPPVRLLGDRVLLTTDGEEGERRSGAGIVIPATASMGRRLAWAVVVGALLWSGVHLRWVWTRQLLYVPAPAPPREEAAREPERPSDRG